MKHMVCAPRDCHIWRTAGVARVGELDHRARAGEPFVDAANIGAQHCRTLDPRNEPRTGFDDWQFKVR